MGSSLKKDQDRIGEGDLVDASSVLYPGNRERTNWVEDGGVVRIRAEKNHTISWGD